MCSEERRGQHRRPLGQRQRGSSAPTTTYLRVPHRARGAGYPSAFAFDDLEDFTNNVEQILSQPGPVMVAIKVNPEVENEPIGHRTRWQTRTRDQVILDLQVQLGVSTA